MSSLTISAISPSSAKCLLVAFFSIFQTYAPHLLAIVMLPLVNAAPLSQNIPADGVLEKKEVSSGTSNTTTAVTPTLSNVPPTSNSSDSSPNSMSDTQLITLLVVFFSVVVAIAIIFFLRKWWQKRNGRLFSKIKEKDGDREPLSASFQPGELPELPYLPVQTTANRPGMA